MHLSPWPTIDKKQINEEAEKQGNIIMAVITEVRREKSEKHMPLNTQVKKLAIHAGDKETAEAIAKGSEDISGTCKVAEIKILPEKGEGRDVNQYADIHFVAEY
jgi:valyl-tRNA synthetase